MISEAINCIAIELNSYLRNTLNVTEDKVSISSIVNQDGSIAITGQNKIILTLINIEKETNDFGTGQLADNAAPTNISLLIMFSAFFPGDNYTEALRFISLVITYFQSRNVLDHENTPSLDSCINKLLIGMVNLSIEQLQSIWATIGAKYVPSVLYKVSLLTLDDHTIEKLPPLISAISSTSSN